MSTHNIGFYEELIKNFFQLSSHTPQYHSSVLLTVIQHSLHGICWTIDLLRKSSYRYILWFFIDNDKSHHF